MNSYSEFPYSILPSSECSSLAMYQMHKQIFFFFKKKRNRCFDPLMDIWTRRLWSPGRLCFCLFVFSFLEVFFCFFELRRWFCAEECTCSVIIYWVSSNCQGRNWLADRNTTDKTRHSLCPQRLEKYKPKILNRFAWSVTSVLKGQGVETE